MGISGRPAGNAYYRAHNAKDDSSISTIIDSITNMQMANNAAACTINNNMSVIICKTQDLPNLVNQLQQQQANYSVMPFMPPPQHQTALLAYSMVLLYTAYAALSVPTYMVIPPSLQQQACQPPGQMTYQNNQQFR
eukprot:10132359-Ditylum_brightwellii.AAC.1